MFTYEIYLGHGELMYRLNARSWGASKCAIRHVGPAMTVEQRWCDGDYTGCITKREKAESTIGFFFFLRDKSILARN